MKLINYFSVDAENVQRELEMLSQATPPCTPPLAAHSSIAGTATSGTTTDNKNGILATLGASKGKHDLGLTLNCCSSCESSTMSGPILMYEYSEIDVNGILWIIYV